MSEIPSVIQGQIDDILRVAPVDVQAIANRLGLGIFQQRLAAGVSGVLLNDISFGTTSGFAILVNQGEVFTRQRFTAAHEIGHFVLHRDRIGERVEDNYLLRSDRMSNLTEQQANRFAADLIMPFRLINRFVAEGIRTVPDLAVRLQVSEVAMAIRLGHVT